MRHLKKNIGIFARVLSAYWGGCNIKRQFKGKRGGGDGGVHPFLPLGGKLDRI